MAPKRVRGRACARANAVKAGTIASRKGSDTATPIPRRNVRRGRNFLVTNMALLLMGPGFDAGRRPHPERHAARDAEHERREPVVVPGGLAHDLADGRHVARLDAAA